MGKCALPLVNTKVSQKILIKYKKLRNVIQMAQLLTKCVKDDSFKTLGGDASPQPKQTNNNTLMLTMLYSEPLSMNMERPGLHTSALWEIRPQLALVESFPLLLYFSTVIDCILIYLLWHHKTCCQYHQVPS